MTVVTVLKSIRQGYGFTHQGGIDMTTVAADGKRYEFPPYVKGRSCLQMGEKKHDYVYCRTYERCIKCGSSHTLH